MAKAGKPTPRQADMLRSFMNGWGRLGADLRTYDACLRRGWIEERIVPASERRWHNTPGVKTYTTEAGKAALKEL